MRSNDSQKIIAVGIPKTLDDAGLSELFSGFGAVAEAKVVMDAATSQSRGFGFVTFTASSAMRAAVKGMNKKTVDGRVLNVRALVPKDRFQAQKAAEEQEKDPSKRPCWLLRKGKCTKGDSCPFSHEIQDGTFGSCFEFVQTGSCKRGDSCKFYHPPAEEKDGEDGEEAAKAAPAAKQSKPKANDKSKDKEKGEKKPRVCYGFQNGRCHRGKKCLFLHEKLVVPADDKPAKTKTKAKPAGFEVVATKAEPETGRKRRREENDEDDGDNVDSAEVSAPVKQPVKNAGTQEKPSPLAGLAAHVSQFMAQQKQTPQIHAAKQEKPAARREVDTQETSASPKPKQQNQRPAKKVKTERVDMGSAFDGLSEDEESAAPRRKQPMDKAARKAARDKLQAERKAKRSAKKTALNRLKTTGEVELEA